MHAHRHTPMPTALDDIKVQNVGRLRLGLNSDEKKKRKKDEMRIPNKEIEGEREASAGLLSGVGRRIVREAR